jgi:hypothetical protein
LKSNWELTLANWAGRAKVGDNKKYDHRTEDQKSEEVAGLMIPENAGVLEKIRHRIPNMKLIFTMQ